MDTSFVRRVQNLSFREYRLWAVERFDKNIEIVNRYLDKHKTEITIDPDKELNKMLNDLGVVSIKIYN